MNLLHGVNTNYYCPLIFQILDQNLILVDIKNVWIKHYAYDTRTRDRYVLK